MLAPELSRPIPTGSRGSSFASAATRRGDRIHLLLQHLAPPATIGDRAWLRELLDVDEDAFDGLWSDAHAILTAPSLRRFFDPAQYLSARNEVAYVDASGQVRRVDRIVEFEDELWVLDYKTGDLAGREDAARLAERYRAQLDAYRRAIERTSARKPVRAALLLAGGRLETV
jgi:ATP-dependent helicase/nuclease subunit A